MQTDPSLLIKTNDVDIKRCLGLDREAKSLESEEDSIKKNIISSRLIFNNRNDDIRPVDFAKSVL